MAEQLIRGLDLYKTPTWDDSSLPPSLKTPGARLEGVSNIVHSGAKSLEVLVMNQNDVSSQWIINRIQELTGIVISSATNINHHFDYSMEKMGIVERGIRRSRWHLTPFGEAIKPAIIFFWRQLRDLQTHPMAVLNNNTNGAKGVDDTVNTGTLTRVRTLQALYQYGGQACSALANQVGFNFRSIRSHIEDLDLLGITTTISHDNLSGEPYLFYGVTTYGAGSKDWFSHRSDFRRNLRRYVSKLENKFREMGIKTTINSPALSEAIGIITDSAAETEMFRVLSDCVRAGFVRKIMQGREVAGHSLVELTDYGKDIVSRAIAPLASWADDPNSVEDIRKIALGFNPTDTDLLEMARIFLAASPAINRTHDHRGESILGLLASNPMTKTEIAQKLGISFQTVSRGLTILTDEGGVDSFIDPVSRRRKFIPV